MRKLSFAMLALLLAASCAKKKDTPKEEEPQVSAEDAENEAKEAKQQAAKQKEQQIEALANDLQTKEDFEEAAEKEITPDNLETELAKLEAELDPGEGDTAGGAANPTAPTGTGAAAAKPGSAKPNLE